MAVADEEERLARNEDKADAELFDAKFKGGVFNAETGLSIDARFVAFCCARSGSRTFER